MWTDVWYVECWRLLIRTINVTVKSTSERLEGQKEDWPGEEAQRCSRKFWGEAWDQGQKP